MKKKIKTQKEKGRDRVAKKMFGWVKRFEHMAPLDVDNGQTHHMISKH